MDCEYDYYSDEENMEVESDHDEGYDDGLNDDEENMAVENYEDDGSNNDVPKSQQGTYAKLTVENIKERQQKDIKCVSDFLSISRDFAYMLLRRYKWNADDALDAWSTDTEEVYKDIGLLRDIDIKYFEAKELMCGICFESYPVNSIKTTGCVHPFCDSCWRSYISISINDGPGCLSLRCPDPSCHVAVGVNMVNILTSEEDREKYHHYLLRNYIEHNKKAKWCPAPGCDCAVEFDIGSENSDVSCNSLHTFCWNCTEDAHRPVACKTVREWVLKNSAESENINWILTNSKPCPKCNRPIQKNDGCMHMTCQDPCKFEFCWLCLESWSQHGEKTGGYYACNRYEAAKKKGVYDEAECRRQAAKNMLDKYTFFYERWAANESSREKALDDLNKMEIKDIARIVETQVLPETYFEFILDAWRQIVECRRLLKWTYAYGYFIDEKEFAKKEFFLFLQGQAEQCLENLHLCAEKEMLTLFQKKAPADEIAGFKIKLIQLTSTARTYFKKLASGIEKDDLLSEVTCEPSSSNAVSSENISMTSEDKSRGGTWICSHCTHGNSIQDYFCDECDEPRDTYY